MRRILGIFFHFCAGAVALSFTGCYGCLNLDEYTLVSTGGSAGAGGTGGAGGAPGCGAPGVLFVMAAEPATAKQGDASDPCSIAEDVEAGVEIRAFDPEKQACIARARIVASAGATLESPPRVLFSETTTAHVGVLYRGGSLTLPALCSSGDIPVIEEEPTAEESFLLTRLTQVGGTFCTDWARRVYTTDISAAKRLRIHTIRAGGAEVAVVGSLGGAKVRFEDDAGPKDVQGAAFFARYGGDGALGEVRALQAFDNTDALTDVLASNDRWLTTGSIRAETPSCYGCSGSVHVVEPAAFACAGGGAGGGGGGGGAGSGGAGSGGMAGSGGAGSGGMAGSGGAGGGMGGTGGAGGGMGGTGGAGGGMGGTGGAGGGTGGTGGAGGGGPVPDSRNALLWPVDGSQECSLFQTFGSDRLGLVDSQVGFGMSVIPTPSGCAMAWAGLAGRDAWPLKSGAPETALFDAGGATMDGFVAWTEGPNALCNSAPGPVWNVRLTPLAAGSAAAAERALQQRCSSFGEVYATAFVRSSAGGNVAFYRCLTQGGCDTDASLLPLAPSGEEQLLIAGMTTDGRLSWSAAFGPVSAEPDAAAASFVGRSHHDVALDSNDRLYAVFKTTGPLSLTAVETFGGCEGLVENLAAGTYLVQLRQFTSSTPMCEMFYRFGD